MFDTSTEVAQAGRKAFISTFPTDEKRRGVFRHCQAECLALLIENLQHSEKSLHDAIGLDRAHGSDQNVALERQDRYTRVIVASLSALGELVHVCSTSTPVAGADAAAPSATPASGMAQKGVLDDEALAPLLASSENSYALWSRLASKQPPLIRRAAAECLTRILKSTAGRSFTAASAANRTSVLTTLADDAIPAATAVTLVCEFAKAGGVECWEGLTASKALWPHILAAVRRGASLGLEFLEKFEALLGVLPLSAWDAGRGDALCRSLFEACKAPRAPAEELWRSYFAIVRVADAAGSSVDLSYRWAPVEMYLGTRTWADLFGADTLPSESDADQATSAGGKCAVARRSDASASRFCPPSRMLEAAVDVLPRTLCAQLPSLLAARDKSDEEFLAILAAGAPQVPGLPLLGKEGSASTDVDSHDRNGEVRPAESWNRWFAIVALPFLEPMADFKTLRVKVASLVATQFRVALSAVASHQVPPGGDTGQFSTMLQGLGSLFVTDTVRPERSWAPFDDEMLRKALAESPEGSEMAEVGAPPLTEAKCCIEPTCGWPAEASLLAWPVLPLLRLCLLKDTGRTEGFKVSSAFGQYILRPLFLAGLRRHGDAFPTSVVRDLVAQAILCPLAQRRETNESSVGQPPLGVIVRLTLECIPSEAEPSASPLLKGAVASLAGLVAAKSDGKDLISDEALMFALQPGGLAVDQVRACLGLCVDALQPQGDSDDSVSHRLRLAVLVSHVLVAHDKAEILNEFCESAFRALLRTLVVDSPHADQAREACAWTLLPRLLEGSDVSMVCKALGTAPASVDSLRLWIRALQVASCVMKVSPIDLLCRCRVESNVGGSILESGAVEVAGLSQRVRLTAELLKCGFAAGFASLDQSRRMRDSGMALLWELLLAEEVAQQWSLTSAAIWTWLSSIEPQTQSRFARFCAEEARGEQTDWYITRNGCISTERDECNVGNPMAANLWSLAILRRALDVTAWDSCDNETGSLHDLSNWSAQSVFSGDKQYRAGGHVAAAINSRFARFCAEAAVDRAPFLHIQSMARKAIHPSCWSQGDVNLSVVRISAVLEFASIHRPSQDAVPATPMSTQGNGETDGGAVLVAVSDDISTTRQETVGASDLTCVEELDVGILETHELFLRWVQKKGTMEARDAFATYTAAVWPAMVALTPGMSSSNRTATRMHRFILELLAEAKRDESLCVVPGVLRLIQALCASQTWLESSWPSVVEALTKVALLARSTVEGREVGVAGSEAVAPLVSRAFVDDSLEAVAGLLWYVPENFVGSVVRLLSTPHVGLQKAAAMRLREHKWVLDTRESVEGHAAEVLSRVEDIFQEEVTEAAGDSGESGATCADVIFSVLYNLLGQELTSELFSVEEALSSLLIWVSRDELDEGEPFDGGVARVIVAATKRSAVCNGGDRDLAADFTLAITPSDCRCRCVAALAAWELLLLSVQSRLPVAVASRGKANGGTAEPSRTTPPELVAMVLQLTSEQLDGAGPAALQGWSQAEGSSSHDGSSPLRSLLKLLCVVLTSDQFVGEEGVDGRFSRALAGASAITATSSSGNGAHQQIASPCPDWDVFALAARVLLLMLRVVPASVRNFWEQLPRQQDQDVIESLVSRNFSPALVQAEAAAASSQMQAEQETLDDVEASVVRRQKQLVLQLSREDVRTELYVDFPDGFPLRVATANQPEKMPAIPKKRMRNWMLQARKVLRDPRPVGVGRVMQMWSRSFALFFEGVEDCPICYNIVQLTAQTIPRKACPTCKHKFHSECLYHWFKTSAKATCPLCNQPF
eukprot:TRINITY_DN40838_c0_g2_i1.p1 TRINITY_DN40838_c0_g2~~TRINITY_DN40838_c0_g2_i1.p1  ORF type:complete len:1983 (-),score=294.05 TRINITY_DN40838_c0_g2_i1:431-5794(-)